MNPKEIKPEGINFGAVVWVCCMGAYVYLNVKYRDSLPFFRGGNPNTLKWFLVTIGGLVVIGTVYVWWANKRDSNKLEMEFERKAIENMEEVRGTILRSCEGMRMALADLNHPDAESFYHRIQTVELVTGAAKTEYEIAAARLRFGVVWEALQSTPAGDGDVILNGARCDKYLIKALPPTQA